MSFIGLSLDLNQRFHIFERMGRVYGFDTQKFSVARLTSPNRRTLQCSETLEWVKLFSSSAGLSKKPIKPSISTMLLIVAGECNLNCGYCYADKGRFGLQRSKRVMDIDVAKAAVDLLFKEHRSSGRVLLNFYGGEPLLHWKVIKASIEHAERIADKRNISLRCNITTNGTCFTVEMHEFFKKRPHLFGLLSLDADDAKIHDSLRPYKNGKGTFEDILTEVNKQPYIKKRFSPRVTVTRENKDIYKYTRAYYRMGFRDAYFFPVISNDYSCSLRKADLTYLGHELEKILKWNLAKTKSCDELVSFGLSKALAIFGEKGPRRSCAGGHRFVAVTPDGQIYSCHHVVYDPKFYLGNVRNGIANDRHIKVLNSNCGKKNSICRKCWAINLCGGCFYCEKLQKKEGIPVKMVCDWQRLVFENALAYYYEVCMRRS